MNEDLVINGGFEDGNPPDHWTSFGSPTILERSSTYFNTDGGSYSCHIKNETMGFVGIKSELFSVFTGSEYQFVFWFKIISGGLFVFIRHGDDSDWVFGDTIFYGEDEHGITISGAIEGDKGYVEFAIPPGGEVYLDTVSLIEIVTIADIVIDKSPFGVNFGADPFGIGTIDTPKEDKK